VKQKPKDAPASDLSRHPVLEIHSAITQTSRSERYPRPEGRVSNPPENLAREIFHILECLGIAFGAIVPASQIL